VRQEAMIMNSCEKDVIAVAVPPAGLIYSFAFVALTLIGCPVASLTMMPGISDRSLKGTRPVLRIRRGCAYTAASSVSTAEI
jgi:hypothetical protein